MSDLDHHTTCCPECGSEIHVVHPHVGVLLLCGRCEEILIIKALIPLTLDWAFEEPLTASQQQRLQHTKK